MFKWFQNIGISKKLIVGFLFVALLGLAIGAVGIVNLTSISDNEKGLYSDNTLGAVTIDSAQYEFMNLRVQVRNLVIYADSDKTSYYDSINSSYKNMDDALNGYDKTITNPQDRANFDALKTSYQQYKTSIDQIIAASKAGKPAQEVLSMIVQYKPLGDSTEAAFNKVSDFNASMAADRVNSDSAESLLAIYIMGGVILAALIVSVLLSRYISKLIGQPMKVFAEFAEMLTKGDLNVSSILTEKDYLLKERKDEIGKLAFGFNKLIANTKEQAHVTESISDGDLTAEVTVRSDQDTMGKSLKGLVEKFHELASSIVLAADQVAAGASIVSDSSMSQSQGATEQASSVEELSASLTQIAEQTNQNAQNAYKANELAENAKKHAVIGNDQMNDMLKAMEEISIASSSINKIIKVIDDIAFQTNILALNAAVEAARAGQQGKGFAVVAEEVRTLAAKSATAAKETTDMIESAIAKVAAGTRIANDTASALNLIVTEVEKAAELVGSIAVASKEQAAGIEQVNQGVAQISQVVQTNAANSEESAAASEELSSQAAQLKEIVSIFKLRQNENIPASPVKTTIISPALRVPKARLVSSSLNFGKY